MKRVVITWNLGRGSKRIRRLLVTGRTFAVLSIGSMILVLVIGVGTILHQKAASSPVSSMKGFAAAVSSGIFADMLAMELPGTDRNNSEQSLSGRQISSFLIRLLTDINPSDPKSLLAREYPGMGGNDAVLLRPGSHANSTVGPEDNEPVPGGQKPVGTAADQDKDQGGVSETDANAASEAGKVDAAAPGTVTDRNPDSGAGNNAAPTTGGRNVIFIYHSHNRESWFPELKSGSKLPESPTKNITLLGDRLAQKLEANGIGTLHSSTDYVTAIKNFIWTLSYKYSKKTVTEAMATNKDLKFFFDIHRDSLRRKDTTTTINGKSYAQVFFIVGHANPNWRKNEAFASEIHEALDKQFPGISRGIWGKTTASGNGEYNQSVSPDSVLIEIGGVDNTLEESYRTVDALAKVISKLYWDAEKVSAPKSGNL